jgi:hypothetical protein
VHAPYFAVPHSLRPCRCPIHRLVSRSNQQLPSSCSSNLWLGHDTLVCSPLLETLKTNIAAHWLCAGLCHMVLNRSHSVITHCVSSALLGFMQVPSSLICQPQ